MSSDMNDIKDKVTGFFSDAADTITDKAKNASNLAKLNMELKSKEKFVEKQYIAIGKKVYETEKDDDESAFEEIFLIKQTLEEIKTLRQEILASKGLAKCGHCGAQISPSVRYCPNCGWEITDTEE